MNTIASLDTAFRDFKYALRTLARTPGFTVIAILTLALGIGANTAIFTLLDQILLRLLPVKNPQELVLLTMHGHHYGSNWGGNAISHPMFRDFAAHNEVFSDMFARFAFSGSLSFNGQAERVDLELVSGNYFSTLGLNPISRPRLHCRRRPRPRRLPLHRPQLRLLAVSFLRPIRKSSARP